MARFIVRRIGASQVASLATPRRSMRPVERQKQIEELQTLRIEESPDTRLHEWLSDTLGERVAPAPAMKLGVRQGRSRSATGRSVKGASVRKHPPKRPTLQFLPLSGVSLVDLPEADVRKLSRDLPDYCVFEDRPISLIQPLPSTSATASTDNEWALALVGAEKARAAGLVGNGVTVAILDTGVDESHPELAGKIVAAATFDVAGGAVPVKPSTDTHYHGTHVAGIVAGSHVGVAPGARLYAAAMIPGGNGTTWDFIVALEWAAANPAVQIVNMSAGLVGFYPEMSGAVRDLMHVGILPIFAVGNEGRGVTRSPGNYDTPLSIGACDRQRRVASFSGGGTMVVDNHQYVVPDLVAPGVDIYSCVPGGQYRSLDGTSMATPMVSGLAALLLEKHPSATNLDLADALVTSGIDLSYPEDRQGRGLVSLTGADGRIL